MASAKQKEEEYFQAAAWRAADFIGNEVLEQH